MQVHGDYTELIGKSNGNRGKYDSETVPFPCAQFSVKRITRDHPLHEIDQPLTHSTMESFKAVDLTFPFLG